MEEADVKVLKVINNNVVSCIDDHGRETVVMGKGLGFRTKPGMELDASSAEKVFRMESQEQVKKLQDLISRIPAGLLELCTEIVDYAGSTLGRRLSESIYLTLTDHIQFAIERCRQNQNLQNALLTEVRVFYPEEFTIGCYALEQISGRIGLELPMDEAASIALHLVNAEYDRSMNATMRAAQVLHPMVQMLQSSDLPLDVGSLPYNELLVHLKFMALEAFTAETREEKMSILPRTYLNSIPEAWNSAGKICQYLSRQSGRDISDAEAGYLAICIQRALKPIL